MAAELVRLIDSPNARRYSGLDREAAYQLWRSAAARSLRRVAETLDVSPSTVGSWSQAGGWTARAAAEDAEDAQGVRASIAAAVAAQVGRSLETVVALRDDPAVPARDRLAAAFALLAMAGVPTRQSASTLTATVAPDRSAPDRPAKLSDAERARIAAKLAASLAPTPPTDDAASA